MEKLENLTSEATLETFKRPGSMDPGFPVGYG